MFYKKAVLKNFVIFTRKHLCWGLFFNNTAGLKAPAQLLPCRIFRNICFEEHLRMPRSSHQRCSIKKGVLRNFTKFTGKHLCQSLFFSKVASLRPATLLKKRLWHRCFFVNFVKFLRTPFLQNTSGRFSLSL